MTPHSLRATGSESSSKLISVEAAGTPAGRGNRFDAAFDGRDACWRTPAGVVAGRDGHVGVADLPADVSELDARGPEPRGVGGPQALGRAAGAIEACRLEHPPLAAQRPVREVRVVQSCEESEFRSAGSHPSLTERPELPSAGGHTAPAATVRIPEVPCAGKPLLHAQGSSLPVHVLPAKRGCFNEIPGEPASAIAILATAVRTLETESSGMRAAPVYTACGFSRAASFHGRSSGTQAIRHHRHPPRLVRF